MVDLIFDDTPYDPSELEKDSLGLNNFHLHFVDSEGKSYYRDLYQYPNKLKLWDSRPIDDKRQRPDPQISSRKWNVTPRQFYEEVDAVTAVLGIDPQDIANLIEKFNSNYSKGVEKKLWDLLIPVYVKLRKRGYSRFDLIA